MAIISPIKKRKEKSNIKKKRETRAHASAHVYRLYVQKISKEEDEYTYVPSSSFGFYCIGSKISPMIVWGHLGDMTRSVHTRCTHSFLHYPVHRSLVVHTSCTPILYVHLVVRSIICNFAFQYFLPPPYWHFEATQLWL